MSAIQLTWLGHGTFSATTEEGRTLLLDPWVDNNPACPEALRQSVVPDAMLITHGHFDHMGDAVALARRHAPEVVCIFETAHWLEKYGVLKIHPMNKGGSLDLFDVRITMVHADHSAGVMDDGEMVYGGEPVGYVLQFRSGFTLYFAGDTGIFGDMKLIADLYRPDAACLPIGDLFTMGPREAALACRLLGVKTVIPMHWGTFEALTGTPEALRAAARDLPDLKVVSLKPGESIQLG